MFREEDPKKLYDNERLGFVVRTAKSEPIIEIQRMLEKAINDVASARPYSLEKKLISKFAKRYCELSRYVGDDYDSRYVFVGEDGRLRVKFRSCDDFDLTIVVAVDDFSFTLFGYYEDEDYSEKWQNFLCDNLPDGLRKEYMYELRKHKDTIRKEEMGD